MRSELDRDDEAAKVSVVIGNRGNSADCKSGAAQKNHVITRREKEVKPTPAPLNYFEAVSAYTPIC